MIDSDVGGPFAINRDGLLIIQLLRQMSAQKNDLPYRFNVHSKAESNAWNDREQVVEKQIERKPGA